MAEFGVRATELSAPQGAGSQPIRPVQGPAGFSPDLGPASSLFQGLVDRTKQADPWSGALDGFTKRNALIKQAQDTGGLTAADAKVQRNKLVTEFQVVGADSGWGIEYQKQLSQLVGYTATGTGAADADALVNKQREEEQALFMDAQKQGLFQDVTNFNDLDDTAKKRLLSAQQSVRFAEANAKRAAEERAELRAINAEGRASTAADREAQEAQLKKDAINSLGPMFKDSYDLIDSQLTHLMKAPGLDDAQKKQSFMGAIATMRSQAYTMLKGDQTAYQNYNANLSDMEKMGLELLDPAKRTEAMESEYKRRLAAAKLAITDDPSAAKAAGFAAIFPNSPELQIKIGQIGMRAFQQDILAGEKQKPLPSVVTGDIPTQRAVFGSAREAVKSSMDGTTPGAQEKFNAGASTFASTVKAISTFRAGQDNTMEYSLEAIASPEYGIVVNKKVFNQRDSIEALQTISDVYLPSFTDQMRKALEAPMGDTRYVDGKPAVDNASLMQLIDFQVSSDGQIRIVKNISPELRKGITASDVYLDTQIRNVQRTLEPRINQLIRAGAHLEGTTDYKSFFERNAPSMLRGFYVPEQYLEELKAEGYSGTGNVNNPANWKGNSGLTSQRNTSPR